MRPLRITVVSHNLSREGAPLVLLELVRGLVAAGHAAPPSILAMQEGPLRAEYERIGCNVHVIPYRRRRLRAALHVLRSRSDVVLANTVLAWWVIPAARWLRRPALWFIHESEPDFGLLPSADEKAGAWRALRQACRVVFPSHATREVYDPGARRRNVSVVHNGFDAAAYAARIAGRTRETARARLRIGDDRLVGIIVGTVSPRKSQLDAVLALEQLPPDVAARIHLRIVGDVPGEYSRELHAAAARLPPGAVTIVPYASDPLDEYLAADFALSTSRMEAFPKFVQEAMHFGLPLVVAPVHGIVEQVRDGESALFFPPGDVAALADRLSTLAASEALRERLGQGARAALARLPTQADMVAAYARFLGECVG